MKYSLAVAAFFAIWPEADSFTPSSFTRVDHNIRTQRSMVDPSTFQDSHQHVDMLQSVFSSLTISEGSDVAAIVAAPADPGAGPFGFLEKPIEIGLTTLHTGLAGLNVPGAWGLSIIGMTTLIKIVTYPLTAKQMQSTQKMQVCFI